MKHIENWITVIALLPGQAAEFDLVVDASLTVEVIALAMAEEFHLTRSDPNAMWWLEVQRVDDTKFWSLPELTSLRVAGVENGAMLQLSERRRATPTSTSAQAELDSERSDVFNYLWKKIA